MSQVTLYGLPPSAYVRIARMMLAAKGVEYTLEPVDFRSEAYRAQHPFNRMPALRHGDVQVFECLAIGTYIDHAFEGPALQPEDPAARTEMMKWISVANDYVVTSLVANCVRERFVKPMRGEAPDEALIEATKPTMEYHLDILDGRLAQSAFFAGDAVSLADCFFAPMIHYFAATPEGRAMMPNRRALTAWHASMAETNDFAAINALG